MGLTAMASCVVWMLVLATEFGKISQRFQRRAGAQIHFIKNAERVWMFNERGELLITSLSPDGLKHHQSIATD